MATTITAMDLAAATRKRTLSQPQPIDQTVVDRIVSESDGLPREHIVKFVQRTHADIQRGMKRGGINLETMAAAADALTAKMAGE